MLWMAKFLNSSELEKKNFYFFANCNCSEQKKTKLTFKQKPFPLNTNQNIGEHIQLGLSAIVSRITAHQTTATELFHSNFAVDLCSIIQSTAIRLPAHRHAVLHLFGCWNAGERQAAFFIFATFLKIIWKKLIVFLLQQLFGNLKLDANTEISRHNNFQTFLGGLMLLFR